MSEGSILGLQPTQVRKLLGEDLSQDLAGRVTEHLDVDVVVVDLVGDGYTLVVDGRSIIVTKRTSNWFRQNFSIAHELGHLALGSLCDGQLKTSEPAEMAANQFAAELLMPEAQVRSLNWTAIDLGVLADQLWHWGVSTHAVEVRLRALRIVPHEAVRAALAGKTQTLLRSHLRMPLGPDPVTLRTRRATERRFPTELVSRLEAAVVAGRAPVASLAFALGVPEIELELELPSIADPAQDVELLDGLV